MIRLTLSAFQSVMPAQLNVSQIMSPSENLVKDALAGTESLYCIIFSDITACHFRPPYCSSLSDRKISQGHLHICSALAPCDMI